ncbi:MAG: hypothetical protein M1355_00415 [Patescibacteria group bacterium]|nr:hypothetical protein [Patescibacteria group bacterium]
MEKLIVFASGSETGGGSGFQELAENARTGVLKAKIAAVVSNHENGGVRQKADKLGVKFIYFPEPYKPENYQKIVQDSGANWISLSGWLKLATGLDPKRTINIHPGPLPEFGGPGMYGHHVHEAVIKAKKEGKLENSAVSMHFVTEEYDKGPVFFRYPVLIRDEDTADSIDERVNKIEHGWQSFITNLVVNGEISWDGKDPDSLKVPDWYSFL